MHRYNRFFSAIAAICLVLVPISLSAQSWQENLKEAKQLYVNKMYQNAMALFQKAARQIESQGAADASSMEEAEGYSLLCALKLGQENSRAKAFGYIRKHPTSALNSSIRFEAASSYFEDEKYDSALSLLEEMKPADVNAADRDRYLLTKGICLMKEGRTIEAQNHLLEIPQKSKLYSQAQFQLGYLEYQQGNFAEAIEYFTKSNDPQVPLYMAECHFMLKDYLYVCERASEVNNYKGAEKARFARIVSESAYALGLNSDAEHYFKIYSDQKELSKTDNFYSGMLSYEQGNWGEAAHKFEKCLEFGDADSLSQNALYRLGRCLIELKDKVSAAEAFRKASEMDFNPQVKEDAFFNYAKLGFDIWGNADNLYRYLETFNPTASKKDETYGYIAAKCLEDKKYEDAITALEKISSPSKADISNLQKANLFVGADLLEKGRSLLAQTYLEKAAGLSSANPVIGNLAKFWLAESLFRQEKYDQSLKILTKLREDSRFKASSEYPVSFFNSGYNKFRLNDIEGAYKDFSKYLSLAGDNGDYAQEARLRMADCKFMQRDFKTAAALYESVSDIATVKHESLYAPLQEALAQGLMGNLKKKAEILKTYTSISFKSVDKYSEAVYELGRTLVQLKDNNAAEKTFISLVENPVDSTFYGKALMELGMLYANTANNSKAKEYFKKASTSSTTQEEAQAAMNAYQNICNEEGNPDEFHRWVSSLSSSDKVLPGNQEEKVKLLFNSAEQVYLAEKYDAAAKAFEDFIAEYPDYNPSKTWLYLAFSRQSTDDYSGAAQAFYHLDSLTLANGGDTQLREAYSIWGLEMLFKAKEYNKIIEKSSKYIEGDYSDNARRIASYYIAKSYLATGDSDKAVDLLLDVAEDIEDEKGAEAAYLLVKDAFDRGKFEKVERLVFDIAERKTNQMYWLAKCYLLLGDSYYELGDYEQAKAVYESVRSSYDGDQQIKDMAASKKKQAEEMIKK
ncbi:MAG: tetratricopeptide repeat protein [Bacteroidales bacterium]|nr:tetratricopeptide repeat protein [Bacteroidales bacterium]